MELSHYNLCSYNDDKSQAGVLVPDPGGLSWVERITKPRWMPVLRAVRETGHKPRVPGDIRNHHKKKSRETNRDKAIQVPTRDPPKSLTKRRRTGTAGGRNLLDQNVPGSATFNESILQSHSRRYNVFNPLASPPPPLPPFLAVTSISILISSFMSPATIIVAAGLTSPSQRRSTGHVEGKSARSGRM